MEEKDFKALSDRVPSGKLTPLPQEQDETTSLVVLDTVASKDDAQPLSKQEEHEVVGFASRMHKKMAIAMGYKDDEPTVAAVNKDMEADEATIISPKTTADHKDSAMHRMYEALKKRSEEFNTWAKNSPTVIVTGNMINLARVKGNNASHNLAKLCRAAYRGYEDFKISHKIGKIVDANGVKGIEEARRIADEAHVKGATDFSKKGEEGRRQLGIAGDAMYSAVGEPVMKAAKAVGNRVATFVKPATDAISSVMTSKTKIAEDQAAKKDNSGKV